MIWLTATACILVGIALASITIYQTAKPRTGIWHCRRCPVSFAATEGSPCPGCGTPSPHHWRGPCEK